MIEPHHDCRIGHVQVEEDAVGIIYIRINDKQHRVDFCPVCGKKSIVSYGESFAIYSRKPRGDSGKNIPNMDFLHSLPIPESLDLVGWYREQWEKKIDELNTNIIVIKTFMTSQSTQNECFMQRELAHSQEISYLKRRLEQIEEGAKAP